MSLGPDVIFLGPTLSADEARETYPGLVVLPPAQMGDVASVARRLRPHAIGLVDGVFRTSLSVFHKELLHAVDLGIWVLGSSSMGALRAAETDRLGVRGVGEIYEAFASGGLEDDDEVAVVHTAYAGRYRTLSDAMVTLRAVVKTLEVAGLVNRTEGVALLALQKSRWFPDRHVAALVADASSMGFDAARLDRIECFLAGPLPDPKRADALLLIAELRALPTHEVPHEDRPRCVESPPFKALLARELVVGDFDVGLRPDEVRRHAVLHDEHYDEDLRAARLKVAVAVVSQWLGGPLDDDELAEGTRRTAAAFGTTVERLAQVAASVDLDEAALADLVAREAHLARVAHSDLGLLAHGAITSPYLDELRLSGRYLAARSAADLELRAAGEVALPDDVTASQLLATFAGLTGWDIPRDLQAYARSVGLGTAAEVLDAIALSVRAAIALFGIELAAAGAAEPQGANTPTGSRGP